jgi:hypothetical protein
MGRTYHFECPYCHYRAKVCGGVDSGLHCEVQTVMCHDCRELMDVFTRVRHLEAAKDKPAKFPGFFRPEVPPVILRDGSSFRRLVWREFALACPVMAKHRIEVWKNPGRCPRCGNFMEQGGLPTKIWD